MPEFEQLAAMQAGKEGLTARRSGDDTLPHASRGEFVSGNYFAMLGLRPLAGRLLAASDDREGAPTGVVISYQAWQRDYALDPSVVGSTFVLNAHPVTIIGITPAAFYGDRMASETPDFYLPLSMEPVLELSPNLHRPQSNWLYILGRVRPGTALGPLQAKMNGNLRQWLTTLPLYKKADAKKDLEESHLVLTPGGVGISNMQIEYGSGLRLLMGISGLVLLITCANIANLVLVRGMARRTETSIRMALGAARSRIVRQMLTESVVLACMGGLAGTGGGVRRNEDAACAGVPGCAGPADCRESLAAGGGLCVRSVTADGAGVRHRSGMDYIACRAGRSVARVEPHDEGQVVVAAALVGGGSGRVVAGVAGGGRDC